MVSRWIKVMNIFLKKIPWAKVFHFSSSSLAMIPPSSMLRCSGFVPARMIIIAEPQSGIMGDFKRVCMLHMLIFKG